jgi:hypothetical protein
MPSPAVKSFASKTGKSFAEVEKLWDKAKEIAKKDHNESDENFYAVVTGILKNMLGLKEATSAAAVPALGMPTGKMPCGTPFFKCNDEQFWDLHTRVRGNRQWFDKHYKDTNMAAWARNNKGSKFYLQHEGLGMFRKIKVS